MDAPRWNLVFDFSWWQFVVISCSEEKNATARTTSEPHGTFCTPGELDCLRVLPAAGTYKAHLEIQVRALDLPAQPAEPGAWTEPRLEFTQSEDIWLARDSQGNVQGIRNLSDEEGIQFVQAGSVLCVGFRYEPAVCRTPDEGETALRVSELERTYGDVLSRWLERMEGKKEKKSGWAAVLKKNIEKLENAENRSLTGNAAIEPENRNVRLQLAL
jgi:hypothetical protein